MTIAEVSKRSGLSADTLRYYERMGLITNVKRTESGIRNYDDENLKRIEFIKCMRSAGIPIEMLIEYVRLFEEGAHTVNARKELLVEQKHILDAKLEELKETQERLGRKIENYDSIIRAREDELLGNVPKDDDIL